jgi:hypothetical protein
MTKVLLVAVFILCGIAPAEAQSSALPLRLLQNLHSGRWAVRHDAFEQLVAMQKTAPNDPEIREALIALLNEEDLAAQRGEAGEPDLFEDDDYVAYTDELIEAVQNIAVQTHDPEAWHALVYERYNQTSEVGEFLAAHREALPELTELLNSRYDWYCGVAAYVIADMLAKSKSGDPIAASVYHHYKKLIRWHIWHDPPGFVTGFGIQGLGQTKDPEDISFLEAVAARSHDEYDKQLALRTARDIRNVTAGSKTSKETTR